MNRKKRLAYQHERLINNAEILYQDEFTIKRRANASSPDDGLGGVTEGIVTVGTIKGHLEQENRLQGENLIGDQITSVSKWTLYVPLNTDIRPEDIIVDKNNSVFEVISPNTEGTIRIEMAVYLNKLS